MANHDFQCYEFPKQDSPDAAKYKSRAVFWLGNGPGVVLMHELPGLTDYVMNFGRQIAANGYTVFIPVMFGKTFPRGPERLANELGVCVNREFFLFARWKSSPITDWLRALCREIHRRCGGRGMGAIGLCLSGGFVLSLMVDESIMAPVASEPSLPACPLRDLQKGMAGRARYFARGTRTGQGALSQRGNPIDGAALYKRLDLSRSPL
jgi:dienelactone hydrolase